MSQRGGYHRCGRPLCGATVGVIGVVAGLLLAGPASAQRLMEAFSYAYNNNPQLLAQRALLRSTDEQVPQALSGWRPTVNFTGQAGEEPAGLKTFGPTAFSSVQHRQVGRRITQPAYNRGRSASPDK